MAIEQGPLGVTINQDAKVIVMGCGGAGLLLGNAVMDFPTIPLTELVKAIIPALDDEQYKTYKWLGLPCNNLNDEKVVQQILIDVIQEIGINEWNEVGYRLERLRKIKKVFDMDYRLSHVRDGNEVGFSYN